MREQTVEDVAVEGGLAPAYRTLAALYREPPDERTIRSLREWCRRVDGDLPPALSTAVGTVLEADPEPAKLRAAFTRLLQGVSYGETVPPPYESLYVDDVLNGPSTTEVQAFYLEAGVELAVEDELVDHAGYELAFLAELVERGGRAAQLAFIRTHVGAWLPTFHEDAAGDAPAFYRGVFALTEAVLELHAESLEAAGVTVDGGGRP